MDDAKDTIIAIVCWLLIIVGYNLFLNLLQRYYLRKLHKKYNMGGLRNNNPNSMTWKKASKVFGIRVAKLKKMPKPEIKKVYRMKAKKVHPDHGGSNTKFNTLNEAYQFAYAA